MEYNYSKFKVPDKNALLRAIGQISNLPENSLKKILSMQKIIIFQFLLQKKEIGYIHKRNVDKHFLNFYQMVIIK